MDAAELNSFATVLGIFIGCTGILVAYIEKERHRLYLKEAILDTIRSIEKGRNCKMAVLEDFPEHKNLITNLRPYTMLRKRRLMQALSEYEAWYDSVKQASGRATMPFDADRVGDLEYAASTVSRLERIRHFTD